MTTTDERFEVQYRQALENDARARSMEPRAANARYDVKAKRLVVELANGVTLAIPPRLLEGLHRASAGKLAEVEVTPDGYGLHWPRLDADFSIPGLVAGSLGSRGWMRALAAKGGRASSVAKAAAARRNGRLGGRPRLSAGSR